MGTLDVTWNDPRQTRVVETLMKGVATDLGQSVQGLGDFIFFRSVFFFFQKS